MAGSDLAPPNEEQLAQGNQHEHDEVESLQTVVFIQNATARGIIETGLIVTGLVAILVLLPHGIFGDGANRFDALTQLLKKGKIPGNQFSIVGPAFSIPFYLLGKLYMTPEWWCARYNVFVFAAGLLAMYFLLKDRIDRSLLRKFFLLLIAASMFPNHLMAYYGEVFTAICVAIGILMVIARRSLSGWGVVILGVVNTPASMIGLGCVILQRLLQERKLRYILVLLIAGAFIVTEYTIRRGSFSISHYEGIPKFFNHTVMPYSGHIGFSYPFFFGLLSILFSFGKGLFFFAPGLLLPVRGLLRKVRPEMEIDFWAVYVLWISFVIGLVLVYSPWWAWYGGWFWGPRFFLFASIPASFAIAVRLHYRSPFLFVNLLTMGVLCLSMWVGINGAVYDQRGLDICTAHNSALELLCHYTLEYSVLWHPFVINEKLTTTQAVYVGYSLIVFVYLAIPLFGELVNQVILKTKEFGKIYLSASSWHL